VKGVNDDMDLMIINRSGITIRLAVSDLRVTGRATQGVRLINLRNDDMIAAVAQVEKEEDEVIYDQELNTGNEESENKESNEDVVE
jgi:DNA gyrase subunit A